MAKILNGNDPLAERLEQHRDHYFRRIPSRRVTDERSALAFIRETGFCAAFTAGLGVPCLREAIEGRREPPLQVPRSCCRAPLPGALPDQSKLDPEHGTGGDGGMEGASPGRQPVGLTYHDLHRSSEALLDAPNRSVEIVAVGVAEY